jgi:hypothetical protein
MTIGYL